MLASHLVALVLLAGATGVVFSFLMRETPRQRFNFALKVALIMIGLALAASWLMLPFPG